MLTPYDIEFMERDVRDIIHMWNMRVTILKPLPIGRQPNWNEHMHEYSGKIHYVQFDNVEVERKDQMITNTYTINMINGAGDQADAMLILTTSDLNTFIDNTCRISYGGELWRISNLYNRIGEVIIQMFKLTGTDEQWEHTPDMIVDIATLPPDVEHGDLDYSIMGCHHGHCGDCDICSDVMPIGGDVDG